MADDGAPPRDGLDPFVVDPERALDRRRSRVSLAMLGVAAVLVAGLSGWGLLAPPQPGPSPAGPTARPSEARAARSPGADPSPPTGGDRDDDLVLAELAALAGWSQCPIWRGFGVAAEVGPDLVEAEEARQGIRRGRLEVDDLFGGTVTVWIGGNAASAVGGFGGWQAVRDGDAVWTLLATRPDTRLAVKLVPRALPDGTRYWQERARAAPAPYCVGEAVDGPPARVIEVEPGADPLRRLFAETGMDVCRTWQRLETSADRSGAEVDLAADLAGLDAATPGWIALPAQPGYGEVQVRTWVGEDPALAGSEHGSALVVLGPPDTGGDARRSIAWLAVRIDERPAAIQLLVVETPAGRRAWLPTGNAAGVVGSCSAALPSPVAGTPAGDAESEAAPAPTVELLRGGEDATSMLIEHLGWEGCRITASGGADDPPSPDLLDRLGHAVDASTEGGGPLVVAMADGAEPVAAWIGDDIVALARDNGRFVVALDGSAVVWLTDVARAEAWRAAITPGGRTAWFATGAVMAPDAPCAGTIAAPLTIEGVRSFTCWTDRARCLEAVRTAARAVPDAFPAGTDVAAGIGESCESGRRCPWAGPNMPVVVTAAPPGWASSADVRAFSAGWRPASTPFREVPAEEVGPGVLAMASRPSLPLPVAPADDPGAVYCPASGITGTLRGAPWDPRVAWVALSTIRWPAGFTARFLPTLELVAPAGTVFRAADGVQVSGLAGAEPVFGACAVTRTSVP